jgi:hypothetical protein
MSRELPVNIGATDQFPVWEPDGSGQKHSGLVIGDFTVTIFKDGVEQTAYAYGIAEIGVLGEYRLTWTPDDTGFWLVEVLIDYNLQAWYGEYDVVDASQSDIYEMVRRALGLMHENIFIDSTSYDADGQLVAGRVRLFDSKADTELATDGGEPPPGGTDPQHLDEYTIGVSWKGPNRYKVFKQVLEP